MLWQLLAAINQYKCILFSGGVVSAGSEVPVMLLITQVLGEEPRDEGRHGYNI